MDWYYRLFGLCLIFKVLGTLGDRCWSHHFIVSLPSTNSVMVPFSNHLSLKDFMLLDLSSSLLLRIFTYLIFILLFILATHLTFTWEGWTSFWQITLSFLHFHKSQAVSDTINLYFSVACLIYFPFVFLSLRLLNPLRSASLGTTQLSLLFAFMGSSYSLLAISHICSLPSIVHEKSMWSIVSRFWQYSQYALSL